MSTGRDLNAMSVSLIIVAGNNFTANRLDVPRPVEEINASEVIISEIIFMRAPILISISIKKIVILVEHNFLIITKIFDRFVRTRVKTVNILTVFFVDVSNLAEHVITDSGNS
jgi:hypothetical protein